MSIVRVGATKQYSDNWDNIFGGGNAPANDEAKAAGAQTQGAKVAEEAQHAKAQPRARRRRIALPSAINRKVPSSMLRHRLVAAAIVATRAHDEPAQDAKTQPPAANVSTVLLALRLPTAIIVAVGRRKAGNLRRYAKFHQIAMAAGRIGNYSVMFPT